MKVFARVGLTVIYETKWIWPGSNGWTFGHKIFIKPGLASDHQHRLISHELVHVEQFDRLGKMGFLLVYLRNYFANLIRLRNHRKAYLAIRLEVEARNRSNWDSDWEEWVK